jgi:3-dehydroquinate dehydratase-2
MSPKPIYVLNGPNLNLLGQREPEIYGRDTLEDVRGLCEARAAELGTAVEFRQTNHEGELVDWVQEARERGSALLINAAGYTHTSVALLDALRTLSIPVVEVHLSNPAARESYRRRSYVAEAAQGTVSGFGALGYTLALDAAVKLSKR